MSVYLNASNSPCMQTGKIALLHLPFLAALLVAAIYSPSVGGEGDTIMHYFIAEQALTDPVLFFDLWGKPLFTLFAAPFTLLGFTGIKIFNVLCGVGAVFLSTLTAKKLNYTYYWVLPFLALLVPAFPFHLLSGLTEPFGALLVSAILLLLVLKKNIPAYILVSFLPYARSEAKVLLIVFIIYAIFQKHYRYLPLLLTGSILYALIGSFWKDSVFWIFESPYASGASVYGHGEWNHYIKRLMVMNATPAFILLLLGLLSSFIQFFTNADYRKRGFWLTTGNFLVLFCAHSTVWALGIFASAGLERVLIIVFPPMWLLMTKGIEFLSSPLKNKNTWRIALVILCIGINVKATFYNNDLTYYYANVGLNLSTEQKLIQEEIAPYIKEHHPNHQLFVADEGYLGIALVFNMIDHKNRLNWDIVKHPQWHLLNDSTLFFWDSQMPPVQYGVTEEKVSEIPWLKEVKRWEEYNGIPLHNGRKYILYVFDGDYQQLRSQYEVSR